MEKNTVFCRSNRQIFMGGNASRVTSPPSLVVHSSPRSRAFPSHPVNQPRRPACQNRRRRPAAAAVAAAVTASFGPAAQGHGRTTRIWRGRGRHACRVRAIAGGGVASVRAVCQWAVQAVRAQLEVAVASDGVAEPVRVDSALPPAPPVCVCVCVCVRHYLCCSVWACVYVTVYVCERKRVRECA